MRLLDQALTYGELDRLSNQIANALIAHGVVPGDRVGIYLHKSPSAIAGIFGIMKTGACYVPVDANAPGMRLEEIGRQCAFRALITSHVVLSKIGHELPPGVLDERHFLRRSGAGGRLAAAGVFFSGEPARSASVDDPAVAVIDHDLAYILFTSGSTGTPKGVMLSHLDASHFCELGRRDLWDYGGRSALKSRAVQF